MMKKFLINIALFLVVIMVIGEIVVRVTHPVSDIPKRIVDSHGIQKYLPNQVGYWKGGQHKWIINEYGWPGPLPEKFDNLFLLIGDSFIENFMNPNECHQAVFLKEKMKDYDFMEFGRSGVSLIEAMEISEQMDSLEPTLSLIYVNDSDFYESVVDINPLANITQVSLEDNTIRYGKINSPGLKNILYNWKLAYYLYNRFPIDLKIKTKENSEIKTSENDGLKHKQELNKLLAFITANYVINDKILIFHPNSNDLLIKECKNAGFNVIELDSDKDKDWTFGYDYHWTCYGNERAAQQISDNLIKFFSTNAHPE